MIMKMTVKLGVAVLIVAVSAGSASSAQAPPLNKVMRQKLEHAQHILGALVTSDWEQLERHGRQLAQAAQEPAWAVLKAPEYIRHSQAFLRATDEVIRAAQLRNIEAASQGFVSLSMSCVSCHRYMARSRIVIAPSP
jgi:CelD/BcsL family acetyltransferase involved in cellulose biosynthesis